MSTGRRVFWFGVAGVGGFAVDAGVLYLFKGALGLYGARVVSFLCAVAFTWVFNRTVTFRALASGLPLAQEFSAYALLMLLGGAVNYGCYAVLVGHSAAVARAPVLGVAAGSLAGMVVNLLSARFMLFRKRLPG